MMMEYRELDIDGPENITVLIYEAMDIT